MDPSKITESSNVFHISSVREKYDDEKLNSLLSDIKLALQNLLDTGEETIIDFSNFPCDEKCEQALKNILGRGDVTASLNIFGCDSIIETGIHGVWWVYHLNDEGAILTKALYIAYVPSILPAQQDDIEYGISVLSRRQSNNVI
jgi:hydrogenase-1 operon protein HyaF